jgi:hypothetical protein
MFLAIFVDPGDHPIAVVNAAMKATGSLSK